MMFKKLLPLIAFCLPLLLRSQTDAPLRIELQSAKDQNDYHFANMGEEGVLVFYEADAPHPDSSNWVFIHYDTIFQKDYHFTCTFPALTEFISYSKSDNYIYIFLQKRFPKKATLHNYLLTVQLHDRRYHVREIDELKNKNVDAIQAIDNQIVIHAGDGKKDSVYFYHFNENDLLCIGDIFPYRMEFCEPDTFNHRWLIGLTQAKNEAPGEIFIYEYNYLTQKANIQNLQTEFINRGDYLYNSARAIVINADTTLLLGTYNTLQDRYSSNLHSGVYTLLLRGRQLDSTRFYNYTNLKGRNTPTEQTGKNNNSNLNLQVLVGRTARGENRYALATEVFYPEYNRTYNSYAPYSYDFYGLTTDATTFIGYRYSNAYITTFDKTGRLLWDNYFPFNNILSKQLYPHIHIHFLKNEETLIYYPHNNRIMSMLVNGAAETVEKLSATDIETGNTRDVVEYNVDTEIEPWYGNYFLVSGYQYLRNRNKAIKAKRYVFFLNKLGYR